MKKKMREHSKEEKEKAEFSDLVQSNMLTQLSERAAAALRRKYRYGSHSF